MNITDLNECLSELPEISVLEFFRGPPVESPFRWTGEDAIDAHSADLIGPIFVDDRGIEYVVHMSSEKKVSRVTRPNNTVRFQDMTCSSDVPPDLRQALIVFASGPSRKKAA
jgi:hypothetical protein